MVSVRTAKDRLYVYDRKLTEIKYLLNREDVDKDTLALVSPYNPRLFLLNTTLVSSVSISPGYILVQDVKDDTHVAVTAVSGELSCTFDVIINVVTE